MNWGMGQGLEARCGGIRLHELHNTECGLQTADADCKEARNERTKGPCPHVSSFPPLPFPPRPGLPHGWPVDLNGLGAHIHPASICKRIIADHRDRLSPPLLDPMCPCLESRLPSSSLRHRPHACLLTGTHRHSLDRQQASAESLFPCPSPIPQHASHTPVLRNHHPLKKRTETSGKWCWARSMHTHTHTHTGV